MFDDVILEEQLYCLMNMLSTEEHLIELIEKNNENHELILTLYEELLDCRINRQLVVSQVFNSSEVSDGISKSPKMAAWCTLKHQLLAVTHIKELISKEKDLVKLQKLIQISTNTMLGIFRLIKIIRENDFNSCIRCEEDSIIPEEVKSVFEEAAKKVISWFKKDDKIGDVAETKIK